ncbi:MAG: hypothetical protein EBY21_02665 [Alphaproteobacteria bacterium]|nr:hypothetical protein [Alphaproteobacteria bacterium]
MSSPSSQPSAPVDHRQNQHDHDHHDHAHDHPPMGAQTGAGATWSLLGLSVLQRVIGALVVIALIWASVFLVLDA